MTIMNSKSSSPDCRQPGGRRLPVAGCCLRRADPEQQKIVDAQRAQAQAEEKVRAENWRHSAARKADPWPGSHVEAPRSGRMAIQIRRTGRIVGILWHGAPA